MSNKQIGKLAKFLVIKKINFFWKKNIRNIKKLLKNIINSLPLHLNSLKKIEEKNIYIFLMKMRLYPHNEVMCAHITQFNSDWIYVHITSSNFSHFISSQCLLLSHFQKKNIYMYALYILNERLFWTAAKIVIVW